ncbi:MAG: CHASE2 domain-containing protein [Candidatus Sericytochromatia bacterium]|nr:CHASE2 domain-containing protein [Candidatus Tanganyikabacteria bacterium]
MRLHAAWPGRRSDLPATGLVALGVGAVAWLGTFEAAEESALRLRFELRGARPVAAPVAIVAIDERALAALGQMPWNRKTFATLLDRLREGGAAAVAIDVAFSEPGGRASGEDRALQAALRRFGPVVLAAFRPLESAVSAGSPLVQPLPGLRDAAWGVGLAHFSRVGEFTVFRVEPQQPAGSALVPTLGLALARAHAQAAGGTVAAARVPESFALDFAGPPGTIPTVSARDVLDRPDVAGRLAGRAVLIGATAAGLPDTGFGGGFRGPYSGVELHATVAENLLGRGGLRQPDPLAAAFAWLLLALAAGWPLAATRTAPATRLGLLGAALAALGGCALAALHAGIRVPVVAPAVLLGVCGLAGILRQEADLLRERARLLGWYADELAREARRQRERIDGELHDEAQQLLVVMSREARKLEKSLGAGALGQLPGLLARTSDEIIRVRKALVPHTLRRQGLRAATEEMVREVALRAPGVRVDLVDDTWPAGVDPGLEAELYWLLKECLNNAVKHAGARQVTVRLGTGRRGARVEVVDDGRGFEVPPLDVPPTSHEHTGLHRMWIRARGLGGQVRVASEPGRGTRVAFEIPLRKMADASLGKPAHP